MSEVFSLPYEYVANSNAFSPGDQKMSTSEAPPEAGRRTPATQLQLSN